MYSCIHRYYPAFILIVLGLFPFPFFPSHGVCLYCACAGLLLAAQCFRRTTVLFRRARPRGMHKCWNGEERLRWGAGGLCVDNHNRNNKQQTKEGRKAEGWSISMDPPGLGRGATAGPFGLSGWNFNGERVPRRDSVMERSRGVLALGWFSCGGAAPLRLVRKAEGWSISMGPPGEGGEAQPVPCAASC